MEDLLPIASSLESINFNAIVSRLIGALKSPEIKSWNLSKWITVDVSVNGRSLGVSDEADSGARTVFDAC